MSSRVLPSSSFLALALCGFAYLYAWPLFPGINNPNENVRVQMTAAIVDFGTYRIDRIRERWGFTNDAACVDRTPDGRRHPCTLAPPTEGTTRALYSVKAPLTSLLGVPAYAVFRTIRGDAAISQVEATRVCRLFGTLLPVLALLVVARRFLELDLGANPLALETGFFALALGSVAFGYALLFVSHTTSALFTFTAFAQLVLARRTGRIGVLDAAFTGFLASGVTALEYPAFFVSVGLCLAAARVIRPFPKLLAFGLGALVPVLLVMHFQATAFGSPFSPGHLFVENPGFRAYHEQGFFGADGIHLDAAVRLLADARLGALPTTPFLLLAPIGAIALLRDPHRRADARLAIGLLLALFLPVVFLSNWDGGWVIGPRYLVTVLPLAIWLAAHGASVIASAGAGLEALPLGLLLASLVVSGSMSTYYPHLPPELRAPLVELVGPLIRDGFAPSNLGLVLGLPMRVSMLPLGLLAIGIVVRCARARADGLPGRSAGAGSVVVVALLALTPSLVLPAPDPGARAAFAFVESHWSPTPE